MPPVCPSLSPGALRRQTLHLPLAACRGLYSPGSFPSLSGPAVSGAPGIGWDPRHSFVCKYKRLAVVCGGPSGVKGTLATSKTWFSAVGGRVREINQPGCSGRPGKCLVGSGPLQESPAVTPLPCARSPERPFFPSPSPILHPRTPTCREPTACPAMAQGRVEDLTHWTRSCL